MSAAEVGLNTTAEGAACYEVLNRILTQAQLSDGVKEMIEKLLNDSLAIDDFISNIARHLPCSISKSEAKVVIDRGLEALQEALAEQQANGNLEDQDATLGDLRCDSPSMVCSYPRRRSRDPSPRAVKQEPCENVDELRCVCGRAFRFQRAFDIHKASCRKIIPPTCVASSSQALRSPSPTRLPPRIASTVDQNMPILPCAERPAMTDGQILSELQDRMDELRQQMDSMDASHMKMLTTVEDRLSRRLAFISNQLQQVVAALSHEPMHQ